jgi:hypothetical protein
MKVSSQGGVGSAAAPRGAGRPAASGFSLSDAGGATETAGAARMAGVGALSSLDALIALQEVGGPLERRRKAVRRAGRILDVLDEVKIALLDGGASPEALDRLVQAVRQERGEADDAKLSNLLNEIETRAAVEMAKLQMAQAAA